MSERICLMCYRRGWTIAYRRWYCSTACAVAAWMTAHALWMSTEDHAYVRRMLEEDLTWREVAHDR